MIRFSVKGLEISIVPVAPDETEDLDELAGLIPAKPKILWYRVLMTVRSLSELTPARLVKYICL